MRIATLLLLVACDPAKITVGTDTGPEDTDTYDPSADADGDGYPTVDAGGTDCNDQDAAIHPDATEVWYDGVDQDCDGGSDFDQDGDSVDQSPTGTDCDDVHADIFPGAVESRDLTDQDCDGYVDEDFMTAGIVVISEIMHHPLESSDADGEWFELTNTDANSVDLIYWTVSADDGDAFTIGRSVVIPGGGSIVLGVNASTGSNGGVGVDFPYNRDLMSLSAEDTLFLSLGSTTIFDVEWTSDWTSQDGASLSLDPDHTDLTEARQSSYWCVAKSTFGDGDLGTPGDANDDCTNIDEDGDGYSVDRGDCDDADASISPRADELWDGIDNDCDDVIDTAVVTDVAAGYVDGSANSYLSVHSGLGLGDVTGDGTPDLLAGGNYQSSYSGAIYVVDGADADSVDGPVTDHDIASGVGSTYSYLGSTSGLAGDVTGDGVADLVVAGSGYGYYSPNVAMVIAGGSELSGSYGVDDADILVTSPAGQNGYSVTRVTTSLDLDGDGVNELVVADSSAAWGSKAGAGYVWVFASGNLAAELDVDNADGILYGSSSSDYAGIGLGGTDVDSDGYDDLFVGASGEDVGGDEGGAWFQVDGSATQLGSGEVADLADRTIEGSNDDDGVGFGPPAFGDFDGDGSVDLAFGGFAADKVWIFSSLAGLSDGLETDDTEVTIDGDGPPSFGFAVAAGDFDGDGTDDLAVGAPGHSNTYSYSPAYWFNSQATQAGELGLFSGDQLVGALDASDAEATATGENTNDLFASVISGADDIDGDGADDLLVGAPRGGTNASGRAYVLKMH
jgi:hypothetical protein